MHKIFKAWLFGIFFITLVAIIIVGINNISSPLFGFLLLPLAVVTAVIIILGYYTERK